MIELCPNTDNAPLPDKAVSPAEQIDAALAQVRVGFAELTKNLDSDDGIPHLLFAADVQRQQQQQQQ